MLIKKSRLHNFTKWLFSKPARTIVLSFVLVDFIGTLLLLLPAASQDGKSIGLLGALFTTVSCTCVTGLVVTDTATHFTTFGRYVIICLIQIGGLGLVTLTTFFISLARKKVGLRAKVLAQEASGSFSFMELPQLIKSIILITLGFEGTGFVLLASQYIPRFGWIDGLSKAGFQAVSAFCNAGFDLMGDTASGPYSSLTAWNGNPVVIMTTGFLIIFGGLGFTVWRDIFKHRRGDKFRLHSIIAMTMTATLVIGGMIFFLLVEWSNTGIDSTGVGALGTLPEWQRPIAAFFQSVTLRTAGFNSISQSNLTDASKFISSALMFIGAGSGSTGGGIKISTFTILVYTVICDIRGRDAITIKKQQVSHSLVQRAVTILFLGLAIMLGLSLALCFTERKALEAGTFEYLDLLFESASAFGTVGVTSASTPTLLPISQWLIIPAMFLGRVGPATFAISLAMHEEKNQTKIYPEAKISIG